MLSWSICLNDRYMTSFTKHSKPVCVEKFHLRIYSNNSLFLPANKKARNQLDQFHLRGYHHQKKIDLVRMCGFNSSCLMQWLLTLLCIQNSLTVLSDNPPFAFCFEVYPDMSHPTLDKIPYLSQCDTSISISYDPQLSMSVFYPCDLPTIDTSIVNICSVFLSSKRVIV